MKEKFADYEEDEPDNRFLIIKLEDNDVLPYEQKLGKQLFMMKIRAQVNTQRHYEIYSLTTDPGIDKETIEVMFEKSPQQIVDLIREKGVQLYSNRATGKPVII